ncbi:hypothetical protein JAAARDRAFT_305214 [Jaapia argillacea MUCL 33604]|uniref:Uncharacterized protein n=1 Tax=Jaapia argillacea MUCL 33604 TaxID=933084 RepID=A0A067P280_9AGAM|nr:hypothetical protein JAAARDRAFT_305214 [Jaapia argillacea MUCL 33604]
MTSTSRRLGCSPQYQTLFTCGVCVAPEPGRFHTNRQFLNGTTLCIYLSIYLSLKILTLVIFYCRSFPCPSTKSCGIVSMGLTPKPRPTPFAKTLHRRFSLSGERPSHGRPRPKLDTFASVQIGAVTFLPSVIQAAVATLHARKITPTCDMSMPSSSTTTPVPQKIPLI